MLPVLFAGLVILDFAGKVDLVKVKLECRLNMGIVGAYCALLGVAHAHKVTF